MHIDMMKRMRIPTRFCSDDHRVEKRCAENQKNWRAVLNARGAWERSQHRWSHMLTSGEMPRPSGSALSSAQDGANLAQRTGFFGTPEAAGHNLVTVKAPNSAAFRVHKDAAAQFQGFLTDLHETGYDIQSSGGYNVRQKRGTGAAGYSSHSYGTAIDINAPQNMPGMAGNLPANVEVLAQKHGLVWGGSWGQPGDRARDPMHFELAQARAHQQRIAKRDICSLIFRVLSMLIVFAKAVIYRSRSGNRL